MPVVVPPKRPLQSLNDTRKILENHGVTAAVSLLGVRGYYRDSLGIPGQNDRGIFDDAIFVVSPAAYASFNANTDPSITRPGMAVLAAGLWRYKRGNHNSKTVGPYPALRQAAPVTVRRDGGSEETGMFGINIHRGGRTTTGSEGCQTIFRDQWDAFIHLVYGELERHAQAEVPYLLVEQA